MFSHVRRGLGQARQSLERMDTLSLSAIAGAVHLEPGVDWQLGMAAAGTDITLDLV